MGVGLVFGIIKPCRHSLSADLYAAWSAHLCGLCLALRDGHGQVARVATNYDGVIISVLVEAQNRRLMLRRQAGRCLLRGGRGAQVAHGQAAALAAVVSLTLAAAKVRDHIDDADGLLARRPVAAPAGALADRWQRGAAAAGWPLGLDVAALAAPVAAQARIEATAGPGTTVLEVTAPTEEVTAAAFAHTAVLAGRPANAAPLAEAGRYFGRLAHLLDAVQDLEADRVKGAWNPLAATATSRAEAEWLCRDAVHGIRLALGGAEFDDPALAHRLLAHETARTVNHANAHQDPSSPPRSGGGCLDGCDCTDCCVQGCCECAGDASCCDCGGC